jgi:hypothetical protein
LDDYITRRTRELNQQTRERPHDVKKWLEFVAFQDEMVDLGKKQSRTQLVDKKLSILERALDDNPDSVVC